MFISIPLSQEIIAELQASAECLKKEFKHSKLTYTDPNQYHITLHFLGELDEPTISTLQNNLSNIKFPESFHLHLEKISAFPAVKDPKTIMVTVSAHPFLHVLRRRLANEVVALGIPIDSRPFAPHITLAHVTTRAEVLRPDEYCLQPLEFTVSEFRLVESQLQGTESPIHIIRSRYSLL